MNKVNKNIMVLIENLLLINKNIFADLLIDNFSSIIFEEVFFNNVKSNKSFFEKKIEIIAEIKKGNKKILKKLINFNNEYVKKNYLNLSEKKYLEEFRKIKIRKIFGRGINPEQMILYILTTNDMEEYLDFFKKEYLNLRQNLCEESGKIFEKAPFLKKIFKSKNFQKEFENYLDIKFKNIKKRNLEKISEKYDLEFDKKLKCFSIPTEYIIFFDKKIKEYFEMLEKFKIGFEIFNANFSKMSEQEKEVEELMAELEKLEGENLFFILEHNKLEIENKKLKQNLKNQGDNKLEKLILKQQKEIEKLKNKIENMEQDEKMEVTENINIKELPEEQTLNFKDKNIKVVGGKWSLQSMKKAQKYAEATEFDIEFINATEVFRNSDKLKNSDIIIFDTSYNSHSAYYKLKSYGLKIYRISTSNLEKIKKLNYT